jgi:hypothetical protein
MLLKVYILVKWSLISMELRSPPGAHAGGL